MFLRRLAILILAGATVLGAQDAMCPLKPDTVYLSFLYNAYNDVYFNGNLPRNIVVDWDPMLIPQHNMGLTECPDDKVASDGCKITLSPDQQRWSRVWMMTLLHEECHVATWGKEKDAHGKQFHQCMRRLANEGAFDELW